MLGSGGREHGMMLEGSIIVVVDVVGKEEKEEDEDDAGEEVHKEDP